MLGFFACMDVKIYVFIHYYLLGFYITHYLYFFPSVYPFFKATRYEIMSKKLQSMILAHAKNI